MPYSHLPFRPNVSMITFKDDHFLIVNNKIRDIESWKFPQGGVNKDENPIQTAIREFKEEMGSDKLKVLGVSKYKNTYHWDESIILKAKQFKDEYQFKGQEQTFVILEFLGDLNELTPDPKEIEDHKWVHKDEILDFSTDPDHKHFAQYNGLIPEILKEFNL